MFEFDFPYAHNGDIQKDMCVYFPFGSIKRGEMNSLQCIQNTQVLVISKGESQSAPTSDEPQDKGLTRKGEWSLCESPKFFVLVFYHDSIDYKSILLCAICFSSTALKFCVKRTGENQVSSQDPLLYSRETSKPWRTHLYFFGNRWNIFLLGVWLSRRWQQWYMRFSPSALKIVYQKREAPRGVTGRRYMENWFWQDSATERKWC